MAGLVFAGCGGGTTCGGCAETGYRFPVGRSDAVVQEDVARVRVTQDFLDFVRPRIPEVLRAGLAGPSAPGGPYVDAQDILHIPLPSAQLFDIGIAEATVRRAEALIWLDDLDRQVDLRFEAPNQVRLVLSNLRLGLDARLQGDIVQGDFSCPITGNLGPGPVRHAAQITVEAVIDPGVGPRPDQLLDVQVQLGQLRIDGLALRVLGSSSYCAEPECTDCALEVFGVCLDPGGRCVECHIACGGITSTAVGLINGLIGLLRPAISGALEPVIQGLLGDTLDALNGQPARFEGEVSLRELSGLDFLRGLPVGLLVGARPGRFAVEARPDLGMDIRIDGGAEGRLADCARDLPDFVPDVGPAPELAGLDSQGRPYHIAGTFSAAYMNQILHALHRSGSLCLKLGSDDVRALTGGGFALNASLLSLLASDLATIAADAAPVILELKPRRPAQLRFGSGAETGTDRMGNPIRDWLLQLSLDDLGVAFHVLVENRYVRAFEVEADVFVGLDLTVLPDNRLEAGLGELRIDGFEETFNELLPNANFAEILPALLDLALGALLGQPLTFDLDLSNAVSGALGVPVGLRVNDIFRDGARQDFLTLSLTFTSSGTSAAKWPVRTVARLDEAPGVLAERDGRPRPTGALSLVLGEGLPTDAADGLEYQVRAGAGLWTAFVAAPSDGRLQVGLPALIVPGRHAVEVRARARGAYETLDPRPVVLEVVVDPIPPQVRAVPGPSGLEVTVQDQETEDVRALRLERAVGDGPMEAVELRPWSHDAARAVLPYADLLGRSVTLIGVDGSGNRSEPLRWSAAAVEAAAAAAPPAEHCGSAAPAPVALLLLAWFGLARRRRSPLDR